ncbi:MAG TPA: hypothetical protein VGM67_01780 [Gemmatimonadaceae bacterium]|jgi:hypothetical protein
MLKKLRAFVVVGASWGGVWATTGAALNAWRFLLHARELGLERSLGNLWPWMRIGIRVGGSCGFAAGLAFAILLAVLPPLIDSRISTRWSLGYGIASGLAASLYILSIGYGTMMIPIFAAMFAVTGAFTAWATAAIASREPNPNRHEQVATRVAGHAQRG